MAQMPAACSGSDLSGPYWDGLEVWSGPLSRLRSQPGNLHPVSAEG
jgi:hypothetical protein